MKPQLCSKPWSYLDAALPEPSAPQCLASAVTCAALLPLLLSSRIRMRRHGASPHECCTVTRRLPILEDFEMGLSDEVRSILYFFLLVWCFLGVAIIANVFMEVCAPAARRPSRPHTAPSAVRSTAEPLLAAPREHSSPTQAIEVITSKKIWVMRDGVRTRAPTADPSPSRQNRRRTCVLSEGRLHG